MLTHVLLLQPRAATTDEEIKQVLNQVRTLLQSIPGIVDVQTGENLSKNHQSYTYGFVMHFTDEVSLNAYAPHPAHRVVSDELLRLCSSIIDFDLAQQDSM